MPVFSSQWRLRSNPLNEDKRASAQAPPMRGERGRNQDGLWGALGRPWSSKNLPRTLQLLGAGLQGGGAVNAFLGNESEQRRRELEEMMLSRQQQQQAEQRSQLEQAIAGLPIDQQAWARLNPEAFARAMMEAQSGGWETNGTTPYRVGPSGEVIQGSGTIPHRPRAPLIQYGRPGDADDWEYGE